MREDYLSIISRPHHVSAKRCPMSMSDRAAQFAPFAALTGYDEEIDETARLTAAKRTLTEDEAAELNKTLCSLLDREYENVKVKILYFKPDGRKSGGEAVSAESHRPLQAVGVFSHLRFPGDDERQVSAILLIGYRWRKL